MRKHHVLVLLSLSSLPSVGQSTWDGGGADNNFGTGQNWVGDGSPSPGSSTDLVFDGATRLSPFNNYTAWDDFRNVTFASGASSFSITGNSVDLFGKIENSSANAQTFGLEFSFNHATNSEINPVNGNLLLNGANIFNNGNTIEIWGNNAKTVTLDTVIQGTGGLRLEQNSTAILAKNNSYSGANTINAGTLQIGNGGATGNFGSGSMTIGASGTLAFNRTGSFNLGGITTSAGASVRVNLGTVVGTAATSFGSLASGNQVVVASGGAINLNGVNRSSNLLDVIIAGSGDGGGGAIYNSGAALYGNSGVRGVTLSNNATVTVGGTGEGNRFDFRSDGTLNLAGFTLTKAGGGNLVIRSTPGSTGTISVSAGTIGLEDNFTGAGTTGSSFNVAAGAAVGGYNGRVVNATVTLNGSTAAIYDQGGTRSTFSSVVLSSGGLIDQSNRVYATSSNGIQINGTNSLTGTGNLTVSGGDRGLYLGGTHNMTGVSTIDVQSGYVEIVGGGLVSNAVLNLATTANTTRAVDIWDGNATFRGLTGGNSNIKVVTNNNKTLILNPQTGETYTFSGVLQNYTWNSSSVLTLQKEGAGTQVLSGANTYTGNTTINGGKLSLSGGSGLTSAAFTVNTGATLELNGTNIFTTGHGNAMANSRVITVNNGTLLMTSNMDARFGNVVLNNGSTWTSNRGLGNYDALLANTSSGAATVSVTGNAASTMNGTGGIHLQGVQNFSVADVTSSSADDLTVSMSLDNAGTTGGALGGINKTGAGTMLLSGANTFTGGVTVGGGVLAVDGNQQMNRLPANSSVTVNNTGVFEIRGVNALPANASSVDVTVNAGGTLRVRSGGSAAVGAGGESHAHIRNLTLSGGLVDLTYSGAGTAYQGESFGLNGNVTVNGSAMSTIQSSTTTAFSGVSLVGTRTFTVNEVVSGTDLTVSAELQGSGGGLTKAGAGTLLLSAANTYTGVTSVNAGVLRLDGATALPGGIGPSGGTSALTFNGGVVGLGNGNFTRNLATAGTATGANFTGAGGWAAYGADRVVNLNNDSHTIVWGTANTGLNGQTLILGAADATNTVDFQNPLDLGAATRTVQVDNGSADVDGKLSALLSGTGGGLTKTGAGKLELVANNTFTGATSLNGGTLLLGGASAAIASSGGVAIGNGATLLLSNTSAVNNTDRLNNAGTVAMSGGTLNFSHTAGAANYSETTGALSVTAGANTIQTSQAAVGQSSILTFASLSISGGSLNFSGTEIGLTTRNQIKFTTPPSLDGSGLIANATLNGNANVTYSLNDGVVAALASASISVQSGVIPNGYISTVSIDTVGTPGPITLATPTTTINTLTQNYAGVDGTVDLAGQTLRMSTATILAGKSGLTFGTAPGSGTIMARDPAGELVLSNLSSNALTVNAVIADNITASTLTKTGGGTLVLAGAATFTGATAVQEGTLQLAGTDRLPTGSALTLGAGTTSGTLKLDGNNQTLGSLTTSGSGTNNRVVNGSATAATLTIGGGSTFAGVLGGAGANENNLALVISGSPTLTGNNTFTGDVTLNTGSTLSVPVIATSGAQPLGQSGGAIHFQGNVSQGSTLVYSGSGVGETNRGLEMASGQGGTLNVSQASGVLTVNGALSGAADFQKAGPGTVVLTASDAWSGNGAVTSGTLVIGALSGVGSNTISGGNWDVATGATLRVNTTGALEASTVTRNGTFNLEAGTLRTNNLAGSGSFIWGNANLATLGNNTMGVVDRTDPAGAASGPVVKEGNILNYAGNLATTTTSGEVSVLDLGTPLQNDGLRYNQLKVTGTLDLSGADELVFNISPYFLRPTSASSVVTGDWGTLRLVMADTITGTFDSITGISTDAIGWSPAGSFSGAANLPLNSYYIEYVSSGITEEGIQAGAAILFHYKVAGSVPEPASAGLLVAGAMLLRALRRRRS